jgi:hypothetical protein
MRIILLLIACLFTMRHREQSSEENKMSNEPSKDARLKSLTDLWIHANNLMWNRLQTLYFIQVAFFAVASYGRGSRSPLIIIAAGIFALISQVYLLIVVLNDRKFRDSYGSRVNDEFGIDLLNYQNKSFWVRVVRPVGFIFLYLL